MFPAVWPSENGGWAVIAYRVKAMFQTASSAVMFAESDFRYEGCKAAAGFFFGKQPFAIAEIVTGLCQPAGAPTSVMAMRQRFEARGIFRLPLEAFAETLAKCQPAPAFGKIELRVEQLYHQTVRQPLPPCISFCFRFGPLYGRQALAQVVGKFNHAHGILTCKIGNIAHCFIFWGTK